MPTLRVVVPGVPATALKETAAALVEGVYATAMSSRSVLARGTVGLGRFGDVDSTAASSGAWQWHGAAGARRVRCLVRLSAISNGTLYRIRFLERSRAVKPPIVHKLFGVWLLAECHSLKFIEERYVRNSCERQTSCGRLLNR